jgi:cytochrome c556
VKALLVFLAILALAAGADVKKEYLEKRAAILRQMAEAKAKLAALEVELQVLEESRPADAPAPPAATVWRDEPAAAEGTAKKPTVRCLSVTRDGKRCTRAAETGAKYCWQHRNH